MKVSLRQDIPSTGVFFSMVGVAPESQGVREVSCLATLMGLCKPAEEATGTRIEWTTLVLPGLLWLGRGCCFEGIVVSG